MYKINVCMHNTYEIVGILQNKFKTEIEAICFLYDDYDNPIELMLNGYYNDDIFAYEITEY